MAEALNWSIDSSLRPARHTRKRTQHINVNIFAINREEYQVAKELRAIFSC